MNLSQQCLFVSIQQNLHAVLLTPVTYAGEQYTRILEWDCPAGMYSSGQNKVPTAELKSRLIVMQKSFDSRLIVVLQSLNGKSFPPTHHFSRCFFSSVKVTRTFRFSATPAIVYFHPPLLLSRPNSLLVIHRQDF